MAKGARSKIKKRFRSLKREQFQIVKGDKDLEEMNKKLNLQMNGVEFRTIEPLNGFKYPNLGSIPQCKPQETIDFRSSHVPLAGNQFRGAERKKNINGDQVIKSYDQTMNDMDYEEVIEQQQDESIEASNQDESMDDDQENNQKQRTFMDIEKKQIKKQKFKKVAAKRSKKTLKF